MGISFNAEEILGIAVQIERNGQKFYKQAAANIANEEHKKLLEELAAMEVAHEKYFSGMLNSLSPDERGTKDYDLDNEAAGYLKNVADGNVFDYRKDPTELLKGIESIDDILRTAIGMEKESVVFYSGIRQMVPEHMGSERIDEIIKEELSHISLLSRELIAVGK